jgi:ATP-dependent RNA helicase DDX24/MAK5
MSKQKQQRILDNGPRILIATPGRLWEFIEADNTRCLNQLHRLSYLVIDEADRMVELGHFDDLDKIIEKITMPS